MRRLPHPRLRPFVKELWVSGRGAPDAGNGAREFNLATGTMHLVFRVAGGPQFVQDAGRRGR
jgi:hypothetical protein